MKDKRCEFTKENGERCGGYKITDSKYCFTHSDDPKIIEMREKALKKANESHKLYLPVKKGTGLPRFIDLGKTKGVKKAYVAVLKAAAQGLIDERKLGALIYGLNGYIGALSKMESMEKVEEDNKQAPGLSLDKENLERLHKAVKEMKKLKERRRKEESMGIDGEISG